MTWFIDNIFSIITLVGSILGLIVGFVKLSVNFKSILAKHNEAIDELREELEKEKEQNKQNYLKQDSKLEAAIRGFNNRLEKIDEMNNSINSIDKKLATIDNDLQHVKGDVAELKADFKDTRQLVSKFN